MDKGDLNINLDLDELGPIKKQYKKLKKYMKSSIYEVRMMNGTEKTVTNLLKEVDNFNLPLFKLATKLEEIALNDSYFYKKKLYPNVDFYSGIILKALGMPESMFTVIFAVARTVGWISQWKEMTESLNKKISRPRQLYTGKIQRQFVEIDKRKNSKKMYPGEIK